MNRKLKILVTGSAMLGCVAAVQATPIVTLGVGGHTTSIADGSAGDNDPSAGAVGGVYYFYNNNTWGTASSVAHLTTEWKVIFNTTTYPQQGGPTSPYMDLNFTTQSLINNAPDVSISFTQDGFLSKGHWYSSIGGTIANGAVTFNTYANAIGLGSQRFPHSGNQMAGFGGIVANLSGALPHGLGTPYSLTETVTVHEVGKGQATGNGNLTVVPDGGLTVALLGFGLVAVEGLRRKVSR